MGQVKADKLMIVAHPDDEAIFGGGTLLNEPGWKVICLTNGSNKIRAEEFYKVMKALDASGEIWDFPDEYGGTFDEIEVTKALRKVIDNGNFRKIVTHDLHGEYGHTQHCSLSQILYNMNLKNLSVFRTSDEILPFRLLLLKLQLLKIYKSQRIVIQSLMSFIVHEQIL